MKWYEDKYEELKNVKPIISVCGDDCAVCPRFLAETEDELRETAEFWYEAGWRDHVVSNEEIKCTGCGCSPVCSFKLLNCTKEHGVKMCYECENFPCEKVDNTLTGSNEKKIKCQKACDSKKEFELFTRAFYEKETNMFFAFTEANSEDIEELIRLRIAYVTEDNGSITEHERVQIEKQLPDYFER